LEHAIRAGNRVLPTVVAFLAAIVIVLGVGVGSLIFYARGERRRTNTTVRNTTANLCDFFRDIGTVALPPVASEFGTRILVDSRNIYVDLHCRPGLSPPAQNLK